jgi:hypothetical protein
MIEYNNPEEHLDNLLAAFYSEFSAKYNHGVESHGGGLWKKKNLVNEALKENYDQFSYLATLSAQIDNLIEVLREEALPYANPQVKEAIIKAINQLGTDEE